MLSIRPQLFIGAVAAALLLGGCAKDPSKAVPAAKVAEPKKEEAKPAPTAAEPAKAEPVKEEGKVAPTADPTKAAPAGGYTALAGPAGSVSLNGDIIFVGSKVTGSHACKFGGWSGYAVLEDGKAEGGSLAFRIDMSTIIADYEKPNDWSKKLQDHLMNGHFFNVAKFPTSEFSSTEVKAGGENGATHTIWGKLTMRGVTKDVTFPATLTLDAAAKTVAGKVEFSINRKDFGIEYSGKPDDLIRDGVVLKIDVKGTL